MFEERAEVPHEANGGLQPPPPSAPQPPAAPSAAPPADAATGPPPAQACSPPGFDAALLVGEPSRESLMMLLSVDPLSLDRFDASAAAIGCELAERLIQALQLQFLAVAQGARREKGDLSEPGAELTAAAGVHPVTAAKRADLACSVVNRLPHTLALLQAGKLARRHVEMVEQATRDLTDGQAAAVDRKVRGPVGLQRRLAETIERVAPGTAEKKNDRAVADRDVLFWTDTADGKAGIELVGPVDRIALIKAALDSCARSKLPDDLRSLGQRRFDVFSDWARTTLGLPRQPGTSPAAAGGCDRCGRTGSHAVAVNVTVGLGALLKLSDAPADLDGHPIPAAVARELAADGRWRRLVLEDSTGRLLDVGAHTYRPGEALARWLVARDRTCRFPRCTVPAANCQLDHIRDFHSRHNGEYVHGPGDGETVEINMAANCQLHHRLKTETAWTYTRSDVDGTITYTAPSGRTYTVEQDHYSDDPQLSAYLTGQTRRRQERERRKQPPEPSPEYQGDPPF